MFEIFNLLKNLEMDEENGEINMGGERFIIASTEILNETRKKLYSIGDPAKRFMYQAGKEAGKKYAESIEKLKGDIESDEQFVEISEKFGTLTGWGKLSVTETDFENHEFTITVGNTFFTTEKDEKTCEYLAGMLAGAGEKILGRDMDVKETYCVNEKTGDKPEKEKCIFEMKPSEKFGMGVEQG